MHDLAFFFLFGLEEQKAAVFHFTIGGTCEAHWCHWCTHQAPTCKMGNKEETRKGKENKGAVGSDLKRGHEVCQTGSEVTRRGVLLHFSYLDRPAAISAEICTKHTLSKAPNLQDCLRDKITPRQIIWGLPAALMFFREIYSSSSANDLMSSLRLWCLLKGDLTDTQQPLSIGRLIGICLLDVCLLGVRHI